MLKIHILIYGVFSLFFSQMPCYFFFFPLYSQHHSKGSQMVKLAVTIRSGISARGIEFRRWVVSTPQSCFRGFEWDMKILWKGGVKRSVAFGFTNSSGILSAYMIEWIKGNMLSSGNSVEHWSLLVIFLHSKWKLKIKNYCKLQENLKFCHKLFP